MLNRRHALAGLAVSSSTGLSLMQHSVRAEKPGWQPSFILSSAMYGPMPLADILPEVEKTRASSIDLWPRPHGTQREEINSLGEGHVRDLLRYHSVKLGSIACYGLGPFHLEEEFQLASRLGREVILVTGSRGDRHATGAALKSEIKRFLQLLQPSIEAAEKNNGILAIENHSNAIIRSPDSMRWFSDMINHDRVGIALAPHHLPQDAELIASLARDLGPSLKFVYAQQYGKGSKEKLPKEEELLQMPGRGALDFGPLMRQLKSLRFSGPIEIFMHPVPRGVPILGTARAITEEIVRAEQYLMSTLSG